MKKPRKVIDHFSAYKISYHRNGIAGRPFYQVLFSYHDGGFSPPVIRTQMMAIVPVGANLKGGNQECYVTDLTDTSEHWRGDCFAPFLLKAIIKDDPRCAEEFIVKR
jgi:hypothetical protein